MRKFALQTGETDSGERKRKVSNTRQRKEQKIRVMMTIIVPSDSYPKSYDNTYRRLPQQLEYILQMNKASALTVI